MTLKTGPPRVGRRRGVPNGRTLRASEGRKMHGSETASQTMQVGSAHKLYELDVATRDFLVESAPLMAKWAKTECKAKPVGGMEQWAKQNGHNDDRRAGSCEWYHGTWQHMRLLNMVAVPPWYGFYQRALSSVLRKKPLAQVLISGCADNGMLATLHAAVRTAEATPHITICDICNTPLEACRWYAARYGLDVACVCDNLITSKQLPTGAFDLIVTDEFLTVLPAGDKRQIADRWKELLSPGGVVVTTAMIGGPTTPELRKRYAENGRRLLAASDDTFRRMDCTSAEMAARIERFATFHTRHMVADEAEVRDILSGLYVGFLVPTMTPGECVNPTYSFQIVATRPHLRSA
jgi:2-polyprenyl-3-methyl-5-hydroxy-6-metoxy-1,4-benzoquinol methylase